MKFQLSSAYNTVLRQMVPVGKAILKTGLVLNILVLAACGGGGMPEAGVSSSSSSSASSFSLGGTISGLTVGGLVLSNNSTPLIISSDASSFSFGSSFTSGTTYEVTVSSQPSGLTCSVTDDSGTIMTADVSVQVNCVSNWIWESGANTGGTAGVYGTQGAPAVGNVPGARTSPVSWKDNAGNLWLFGGNGYDSNGSIGELNDLWMYNPATQRWTWVSGANTSASAGIYGAQGTAASSNGPGARDGAVSWVDDSGNLWLFGGVGYDSASSSSYLNDLWRY